ncbi:MAG TPA: GxxExxY protein [Saprospiraceae bacterium]|nr:GxxExxY protein [Saprospiraceae bacterium]
MKNLGMMEKKKYEKGLSPNDAKYLELTKEIISCAMEVHRVLGNGFQEVIYQRALAYEFQLRGIPYRREVEMIVYYKDKLVGTRRVDFIVYDMISVELKATSKLEPSHLAQAINYLEAYKIEVGLLLNFGTMSLEFHRVTNKKYKGPPSINV